MDSYIIPHSHLTSSSQGSCNSITVFCSTNKDHHKKDVVSVSSEDDVSDSEKCCDEEKKGRGKKKNRNRSECKERDWKVSNESKNQDEKNGELDKNKSKGEVFSRSKSSSISKQNTDFRKRTAERASLDNYQRSRIEFDNLPCTKYPLLKTSSSDSIHMLESSGLTISQLNEHVQTVKKKGLLAEYTNIRRELPAGTFNHSRARHNLHKNRYTDVLCYDHSRVTLAQTDYINASFVDGYMQKNAYISTQGPLPKTFVDFWRMVWQYGCQVIVMTTRTVERQRTKCGQYWPKDEQMDEKFEEFTVFNKSVKSFDSFVDTKLILHNKKCDEQREVRHLQFLSWPDYGVPPAASFLDFLLHVRSVQETARKNVDSSLTGSPGPPLVVHCSAGIGRTGTFITIDICLRRLEDTGTVDVPATVRRIRSQRAFSIQMPDQYVFCYLGIIEHALRTGMMKDIDSCVLDTSESDDE